MKLLLKGQAILIIGTITGRIAHRGDVAAAGHAGLAGCPFATAGLRRQLNDLPVLLQPAFGTFGIAGWICLGIIVTSLGILAAMQRRIGAALPRHACCTFLRRGSSC